MTSLISAIKQKTRTTPKQLKKLLPQEVRALSLSDHYPQPLVKPLEEWFQTIGSLEAFTLPREKEASNLSNNDLSNTLSEEDIDAYYLDLCRQLGNLSATYLDEVPVGALLVYQGEIIALGVNLTLSHKDPTAHAEMQALRLAALRLDNHRLIKATLYVNIEPCPMCSGALLHARVARIVYGASDYKTGACGSRFNLFKDYPMNHLPEVKFVELPAIKEDFSAYFKQKRALQKKAQATNKEQP